MWISGKIECIRMAHIKQKFTISWVVVSRRVEWLKDYLNFCIVGNRTWSISFLFWSIRIGLTVKGAKILTISMCPLRTALWIGVTPSSSTALGLSVKGAKILTISIYP